MTDIILIICAIVFAVVGLILQWRIALLTAHAKYAPLAEERARQREQYQRDTDALLAEHKAKMRDWERAVDESDGYTYPEFMARYFPNDDTGAKQDAEAIGSDWQAVGDGIRRAMGMIDEEQTDG